MNLSIKSTMQPVLPDCKELKLPDVNNKFKLPLGAKASCDVPTWSKHRNFIMYIMNCDSGGQLKIFVKIPNIRWRDTGSTPQLIKILFCSLHQV